MLWRGLRDVAAEDVATAALAMADYEPGVTSNEAFDRLTARLVEELEARTQRDIMAALDVIETDRPGGGAALRTWSPCTYSPAVGAAVAALVMAAIWPSLFRKLAASVAVTLKTISAPPPPDGAATPAPSSTAGCPRANPRCRYITR